MSAIETKNKYTALAHLFDYPADGYWDRLKECQDTLCKENISSAETVEQFISEASSMSEERLQELFTRTFDMAPICCPYVTSFIYGEENFERGELMHRLMAEYQKYGLESRGELPDHVGLLLKYLGCVDRTTQEELVHFCLRGPLKEMVKVLKEAKNVFAIAVEAVQSVLDQDFPEKQKDD